MSGVVRSAQEGAHRAGEAVQSGLNSIKRATVGGSTTGDKVSEGASHVENRASEVGNRASDSVKGNP